MFGRCQYKKCFRRPHPCSMYCKKHKCVISQCLSIKDTGEKNGYCANHRCKYINCSKPRPANSFYCEDHQCSIINCLSPKSTKFNKIDKRSEYCIVHTCKHEDCIYSNLCNIHTCAWVNCGNQKLDNFDLCVQHKCMICDKNVRKIGVDTRFCTEHACLSLGDMGPSCNNQRLNSSHYCTEHLCRTMLEYCDNERIGKDKYLYCKKHKCNIRGCRKQKESNQSNYCNGHRCPYEGCNVFTSSTEKNPKCCDKHMCSINGCKNVKLSYTLYCSQHTCNHINCQSPIYATKCKTNLLKYQIFCQKCADTHICLHIDCINYKDSDSTYCDKHRCKTDKCCNIRLDNSVYCFDCDYDSDSEDIDNENKCAVCFEKYKDNKRACFIVCGHAQTCVLCAKHCLSRCPICRLEEQNVITIFVN